MARDFLKEVQREREAKRLLLDEFHNDVSAMGLALLDARDRIRELEAPRGEAFWWCDTCSQRVEGHSVTFAEYHDGCGGKVRVVDTAPVVAVVSEAMIDRAIYEYNGTVGTQRVRFHAVLTAVLTAARGGA